MRVAYVPTHFFRNFLLTLWLEPLLLSNHVPLGWAYPRPKHKTPPPRIPNEMTYVHDALCRKGKITRGTNKGNNECGWWKCWNGKTTGGNSKGNNKGNKELGGNGKNMEARNAHHCIKSKKGISNQRMELSEKNTFSPGKKGGRKFLGEVFEKGRIGRWN